MNCPKHPQQKMTLLFTGAVCDICHPPGGKAPAPARKEFAPGLFLGDRVRMSQAFADKYGAMNAVTKWTAQIVDFDQPVYSGYSQLERSRPLRIRWDPGCAFSGKDYSGQVSPWEPEWVEKIT